MPVTLGSAPLADFDQPLQLLKDCHHRIVHFLGVLRAVVERSPTDVLDAEGRRALEVALRYFAEAAPRHTADEEESLFPRLREVPSLVVHAVLHEMARLEHDHRQAEADQHQVHQLGLRWLETGRLDPRDREALARLLGDLAAAYAAHIRLEEEGVFDVAARVLQDETWRQIGTEMRARRALD